MIRHKLPKRKTKIVATIGPASRDRKTIADLIANGMDVARLNFSHGTHEQHSEVLNTVREESEKLDRHVAVLQDLCGPKVRIGDLDGGEAALQEGQQVVLQHYRGEKGNGDKLFVEAFDPVAVLQPGERVFLSDGRIQLVCEDVKKDGARCVVTAGGLLRSRSGIAVPESNLNLPCLTDKDLQDVDWGAANDVDYIALSFVQSSKDIFALRQRLKSLESTIPIVAKVERAASLDDITAIVEASDAVMVARGDLGLELPIERVPGAQKLIIDTANFAGTPVITATQMLVSMVNELRPTRAEVSDVCTAVRDGTDAVMLSEETAIGKHPVEAVRVLDRILQEAEREFNFERFRPRLKGADQEKVADAVCYAACNAADKISAACILACTMSGYTARLMAKYRPHQTLFAVTSEKRTLARMAPYWGIEPLLIKLEDDSSTEDEVTQAMIAARDQYGLKPGSRVVITAGLRAKHTGTTNLLEIREIPR